jgi:hypothetical protein
MPRRQPRSPQQKLSRHYLDNCLSAYPALHGSIARIIRREAMRFTGSLFHWSPQACIQAGAAFPGRSVRFAFETLQ